MIQRIIRGYVKFLLEFFIPIAIVVIALTYFAFPRTIALFKNIKTDFKSLLPHDYPSVVLLDEVSELFGGMKNMMVVMETKKPEVIKEQIPKLAEYLEADPMVDHVNWRKPGYDFFDEHKLYYPSLEDLKDLRDRIDRRIQREKLGDLYISFEDDEGGKDTFGDLKDKYASTYTGKITSEFYTDEDESIFVIAIYPTGEELNISHYKKIGPHFRKMIAEFDLTQYDPDIKLYASGGVITSVHEYDSLIHDLSTAGVVSGITILLLILFYFRHIRALLFVAVPLACGIIWNFAIAYITIGHLNMTTAFLFSILFGLGIDFGIHLNARYNEERMAGHTLKDAVYTMISQTGRSSLTAGVTTSAAFIVLVINDFKGFSEFGWIAGVGIMITLLAYIVILPVMFAFEEKIAFLKRRRFTVAGWQLKKITNLPAKSMVRILAIGVSVSVLLAVMFLRFDYNFKNFKAPNREIDKASELYAKVNPQTALPSVILVHSKEEALAASDAVEKVRDADPNTLIDSARSIYDLVPEDQEEKIPIMLEINDLLEDDVVDKLVKGKDKEKIESLKKSTTAGMFTIDDIPKEIKEAFVNKETGEKNQLVYIFLKGGTDLKDGKLAIKVADDIRTLHGEDGREYHAVSNSVIFADVLTVMLRDSKKAIALSFFAVMILLLIDFKNPKYSIITMLPLLSGIALMLGFMSVVHIHLNFFNMIVLPVILGIGIDDGVHFFHRFQEEGYRNIDKVMTNTGGAIVMTTLTTAAGFAGMCFAHHGGLSSIGITANIGLFTCLIATLFFFPAILKRIWKF